MDQFNYNFGEAFQAWQRIPVDDFDYMTADELLTMAPGQLVELVSYAMNIRWDANGWRNKGDGLRQFMGLDKVHGKQVVDFGSGFGLDASQFAANGAEVVLVDMHPKSVLVAQKTMMMMTGRIAKHLLVSQLTPPWFHPREKFDLFWSFGVLHHTPYLSDILQRACSYLNPGGECRVGLYSDKRWEGMMKEPVPIYPTWKHPRFMEFVKQCDAVGQYADFYNQDKLEEAVGNFAEVTECQYLCNDQFICAVVKPRNA